MTDNGLPSLVLVWPVADPAEYVPGMVGHLHLAAPGWEITGRTLCGQPIKCAAEESDLERPTCERCRAKGAEG